MKSELITEDELLGLLREQGVHDVKTVKIAYVESDGGISVKTKGTQEPHSSQQKEKRQSGV